MPMVTMPSVGEGVREGTVTRWLKREGDHVRSDEPLVEIETDKALFEMPSPFDGTLVRILVVEDESVEIGEPLAEFELAAGAPPPTPPPPAAGERAAREPAGRAARPHDPHDPHRGRAYSPVVARLAEEHDVDLDRVAGSGAGGRVTRKDVLAFVAQRPAGPPAATATPREVEAAGEAEGADGEAESEFVKLTPTRRTIARHMSQSHATVADVWMTVEADVTGLAALRERASERFERDEGVRLTYFPLFVRAIVSALTRHRQLNATFTGEGLEVHRRFHAGIAVAAESGLVVPVVRDADRKSLAGLAREIDDLGRRAQERRLTVGELKGATFTIDNTGAFGSVLSQPIVPSGQVAIITTEVVRRELRVDDQGRFAARSVMNLCVSFDHRALDGAQVGAFMRDVKAELEAYTPEQQLP